MHKGKGKYKFHWNLIRNSWDIRKTCILNKLNMNHKPMQGCVMKMNKIKKEIKKKWLLIIFCTQKVKFDKQLQRPRRTDQDKTSSIKASYNKAIRTIKMSDSELWSQVEAASAHIFRPKRPLQWVVYTDRAALKF